MPSRKTHQIWIAVFAVWLLFLSGVLSKFTRTPGILQAFRLQALLTERQSQLATIDTENARQTLELQNLKENSAVQEREIRRVLGYAAADEIIFDFGF